MPVLTRVNGTDYEGTAGPKKVQIVAVALNNNGVEHATFEYDAGILNTKQILGHPGCDFTIRSGQKTFECIVVFNPGSPNARYDLFEVDAGTLVDLKQQVTAQDPAPRIGLRIRGKAPALASAPHPPAKEAAKKASAKKAAKKALAKKAAKKALALQPTKNPSNTPNKKPQ